ncbi:MAG: hypothetical protein ABDI19_08470 [Armatimonadota bacterium]
MCRIKVCGLIGGIAWLLLGLSGCQRSTTLLRTPSAWKQAILNDAHHACQMEAQIQIPHQDRLPALLQVYRPHPDYMQIVEQSASGCLIGGKEYRPTTYLTATERIHWLPHQRRCIITPNLPDKQGEAHIRRLFERNVRLHEVERTQWQGKRWTVVEAWVEGGYLRKRYWITSNSPPYVGRIQTYNAEGVLVRDEQRFRYQRVSLSAVPPTPPTPPSGWKIERPVEIMPADPQFAAVLDRYKPPKGYERVMILKRTCPGDGAHFGIGALYSNGLDCFTLFLMPPECPDAQKADRQLRLSQQPEGIAATIRLPDGRALLLMGAIQPQDAARMLTHPR